jgi:hypothetical protein
MARTTDRQHISEAIRLGSLWRISDLGSFRGQHFVELITDYDERLVIWYGKAGQVTNATYTHWDRDSGSIVSRESITKRKRETVLHHINQKDVNAA